jgi:hypothetical protein
MPPLRPLWAHYLLLVAVTGAACAQSPEPVGNSPVRFSGSIRSRVEIWDWFETSTANNDYAFSGSQIRFQWSQQAKGFDWQIEFMSPILLGLPDDAIAPAPQGQLGLGGAYFAANNARNAAMVFPKQAYVRLKFGEHKVRLGRFEWMDGGEITPTDPTLAAVKRDRVAQRLLAPFGWTHVGRAFDGFHYTWDRAKTNVTLTGAFPTRGIFQVDGWNRVNQVAFVYLSFNRSLTRGNFLGDVRGFGTYYHDWRGVVKTDSRPLRLRQQDLANIRVYTFGGHSIGKWALPGAEVDVLLWGALQAGDWGRLEMQSGSGLAEAGVQPAFGKRLGLWLRGGYNYASGDSNPLDGTHGTFFQMLPTPRPFARFPFFNMMNNADTFAEWMIKPAKQLQIRADYHWMRVSQRNDLWYLGGGAFQPWTFGFIGRPTGGAQGLANLYDVSADWNVHPKVTLSGYFGFAQGRGVIGNVYPEGRNGAMGFAEVLYRF